MFLEYKMRYYENIKKYDIAFSLQEHFFKIRDSLGLNENIQEIIDQKQKNLKLENDKEKLRLSLKAKMDIIRQEKIINIWKNRSFIFLFIIFSIIIIFVYSFQKKTNKNKHDFTKYLIKTIDSERVRFSRDLHDDIVQLLALTKAKLHFFRTKNGIDLPLDLEEDIDEIIQNTRKISQNLHPLLLKKMGLKIAIEQLLKKASLNSGINCIFDSQVQIENLNLNNQKEILFIIKECLSNTFRHSNATNVIVKNYFNDKSLIFEYIDDGSVVLKKEDDKMILQTIIERSNIIKAKVEVLNQKNGFHLILKINESNYC